MKIILQFERGTIDNCVFRRVVGIYTRAEKILARADHDYALALRGFHHFEWRLRSRSLHLHVILTGKCLSSIQGLK